jgi:hypothetical protein
MVHLCARHYLSFLRAADEVLRVHLWIFSRDREHLATLLVSGVDNALRFSTHLFGALFAKKSSYWVIRPPIRRIGA